MDINDRQSRITAIFSACDLDLNIWLVTGAIDDWLGRLPAGERFIGRAEAQGAVQAASVVPYRERAKPALNAAGRRRQERQPLPDLQCSKKTLDLSVQKRTSHPRVNMADTLPPHRPAKLLAELAAIIGDNKLWLAAGLGGSLNQCGQVLGAGCFGVDFQSQNLARKPIQDSRDKEREPQDADLRVTS